MPGPKPGPVDQTEPPRLTINITGEQIEIPDDLFDLGPQTPAEIAGELFDWGEILARAVEQRLLIDLEYQQWRATHSLSLITRAPKTSEWKIKSRIYSHPEYDRYLRAIAKAERIVHTVQAVLDGLRAKLDVAKTNPSLCGDTER